MAQQERSFQHLLPTFIISPGTQVVLKADKSLPDGGVRGTGQSPPKGEAAIPVAPVYGCIGKNPLGS
jgi:hypothetical protein